MIKTIITNSVSIRDTLHHFDVLFIYDENEDHVINRSDIILVISEDESEPATNKPYLKIVADKNIDQYVDTIVNWIRQYRGVNVGILTTNNITLQKVFDRLLDPVEYEFPYFGNPPLSYGDIVRISWNDIELDTLVRCIPGWLKDTFKPMTSDEIGLNIKSMIRRL